MIPLFATAKTAYETSSSFFSEKIGSGRFSLKLTKTSATDFSVAYDPARDVDVLSYTEPGGTRFDIERGKVVRKSSPVKVSLELKRPTGA
jgi:hypothetical protein